MTTLDRFDLTGAAGARLAFCRLPAVGMLRVKVVGS